MRTDLMGKRHAARCAFFSPESRGESSQSLVNGGKMIRTENISESEEQRMNKKIFKRAVAMMMAAVLTVGAALPSSNVFASGSDEEKDTKTLVQNEDGEEITLLEQLKSFESVENEALSRIMYLEVVEQLGKTDSKVGKTVQEIEFCHQAADHEAGRALIVMPLGVKQEFTRDAVKILGYERPEYCRTMDEVEKSTAQIILTNYERVRDGDIRPDYFVATSLDEASVLRSFGSKTYQTFLDKFKGVPYKLVATATPSPNKYKELIHYAGYLEVMDTGQALTRFFQRDSTKANNLTLYPNQEDEFWLWVSSWALFITKPSDVDQTYSDKGYDLPPLIVNWHELPVEYGKAEDSDGQLTLFTEAAAGLKEAARIWLKVTDVSVERLQEITEDQTEEEGFLFTPPCLHLTGGNYCDIDGPCTSKIKYCDMGAGELFGKVLWNRTIKKTDLDRYGWSANPWVWVIEFERCEKPGKEQ